MNSEVSSSGACLPERYEEELLKLSRLNMIGEMAAGIGHEVRNPLATVRGFLQLMLKQEQQPQSLQLSYLRLMIDELDRANEIISEFLSLAKGQAPELQADDLNAHIQALLPLLEADAALSGKSVEAELDRLGQVQMNSGQLRQLFLNLVRNGLEAVPEGGKVTVVTRQEGPYAVLIVEDNGSGIPEEQLAHIWDPFFTTKKQGTGLGLPICRQIAYRHGADIHALSGAGGTSFQVRFPTVGA